MLQQTRVEVVRDYFQAWVQALPTLGSLAEADEDQVLGLWQGLGYYSRARRLREGARFVVREFDGVLPGDPELLRQVPGVGPYSAGAISSIAFGRETPLVDGNVVRVLTRAFGLRGDPGRAPLKQALWARAAELVKGERPGDFNQALMELGATVCTPRRAHCAECPWSKQCAALDTGQVELLPELPKKPEKAAVRLVSLLCRRGGALLVEKLPVDARWWAGLWTLPTRPVLEDADPLTVAGELLRELGLRSDRLELQEPLRHTITRFRVLVHPVSVVDPGGRGKLGSARRFASSMELSTLALPAPHRKLLGRATPAKTSFAGDPPIE